MKTLLLMGLLLMSGTLFAQQPIEIKVWPSGAPNDNGITEVAFSSGYNTPTLFFEQFQKIIHLTPAEYRREINGAAK